MSPRQSRSPSSAPPTLAPSGPPPVGNRHASADRSAASSPSASTSSAASSRHGSVDLDPDLLDFYAVRLPILVPAAALSRDEDDHIGAARPQARPQDASSGRPAVSQLVDIYLHRGWTPTGEPISLHLSARSVDTFLGVRAAVSPWNWLVLPLVDAQDRSSSLRRLLSRLLMALAILIPFGIALAAWLFLPPIPIYHQPVCITQAAPLPLVPKLLQILSRMASTPSKLISPLPGDGFLNLQDGYWQLWAFRTNAIIGRALLNSARSGKSDLFSELTWTLDHDKLELEGLFQDWFHGISSNLCVWEHQVLLDLGYGLWRVEALEASLANDTSTVQDTANSTANATATAILSALADAVLETDAIATLLPETSGKLEAAAIVAGRMWRTVLNISIEIADAHWVDAAILEIVHADARFLRKLASSLAVAHSHMLSLSAAIAECKAEVKAVLALPDSGGVPDGTWLVYAPVTVRIVDRAGNDEGTGGGEEHGGSGGGSMQEVSVPGLTRHYIPRLAGLLKDFGAGAVVQMMALRKALDENEERNLDDFVVRRAEQWRQILEDMKEMSRRFERFLEALGEDMEAREAELDDEEDNGLSDWYDEVWREFWDDDGDFDEMKA